MSKYEEELTEVCNNFDLEKFKVFWDKWASKKVLPPRINNDDVFIITYMKICANNGNIDIAVRRSAEAWLLARGYSVTIGDRK